MCSARGIDASRCPFCLAACSPLERAGLPTSLAREASATRLCPRCLVGSLRRHSSGAHRRFVSMRLARTAFAVFPWRSSSGAHRRLLAATPLCTASPLRFDRVRLWPLFDRVRLWPLFDRVRLWPLVFGVKSRPGGNCWRDGQNTHLGVRLFGSGRRLGS